MSISEITEALKREYERRGGAEGTFIEIRKTDLDIMIGGNPTGLLKLALDLLWLADKGVKGSHTHIDEYSNADIAEVPIVLFLSNEREA